MAARRDRVGGGLRAGALTWWTAHRLRLMARAAGALSLLGVGIILGWVVGADRDLVEAEPAPPSPAASRIADDDPGSAEAPDVRGLSAVDARQVVADFGIPASDVILTERPAAGERGIVVAQDPAFGFPVSGTITLYVSTPAKVPAFAGRAAEEVLDELDQLGAEVTTTSLYSPGVPVGRIASITPGPGTVIGGPVDVVLSAEPDRLPFSSVPPAEGSCYAEVAEAGEFVDSMNGTDFADLFLCSTDDRVERQSWVLKRAATGLTGVLGIPDSDGRAGQSVTVVVTGDGRELGSYAVSYGSTMAVDVDVSGVLRLTISYHRSTGADYPVLGMGDLALGGDATALSALAGGGP